MSKQFKNVQLSDTSNQLVLGGGAVNAGVKTTISATAPAAEVTYTIPDVGASCNFQMGKRNVISAANGANSLTVAQSGSLVLLSTASSGTQIAVPAPTAAIAGTNYLLVLGTSTAGSHVVVSVTDTASDGIVGSVIVAGAEVAVTANGSDAINFVSGTAIVGDSAELTCIGSKWLCRAVGDAAGSITVTN